jgi:photosystem II stability/assembly factor-like uncharacterized protein
MLRPRRLIVAAIVCLLLVGLAVMPAYAAMSAFWAPSTSGFGTWTGPADLPDPNPLLDDIPVGGRLNAAAMANATRGWSVGQSWSAVGTGALVVSTSGGSTWQAATLASYAGELHGVAAPDAENVWAVGDAGLIIKRSTDDATWVAQTSGTTAHLNAVAFSSVTRGWAVGDGGSIRETTDGSTWTNPGTVSAYPLYAVAAFDATRVWAVGGHGTVVYRDGDPGLHVADTGGVSALRSVFFIDAYRGWAVGDTRAAYVTGDGGRTWRAQTLPQSPLAASASPRSVAFSDPNRGIAVGDEETVWRTMDGGGTWEVSSFPSSGGWNAYFDLAAVCFVPGNSSRVWVAGSENVARKGGTPKAGVVYGSLSYTAVPAPSSPASLTLAATAPGPSIVVSWADGANEGWYLLERARDGGVFSSVATLPANATTWTDPLTGFTASQRYWSEWAYRVRAVGAGGESSPSVFADFHMSDTTPPSTTMDPADTSAWFDVAPTISFFATDDLSTVASIHYRVNGGGDTTTPATFVAPEGRTAIRYWSVDVAGNVETAHDATVSVDTQGPTGVASTASGVWRKTAETVLVSASDAMSGLQAKYYSLNGGVEVAYPETGFVVAAEGTTAVRCAAVDNVDNRTDGPLRYVLIDYTSPVSTATGAPGGWVAADTTVTLTSTDGGSGVSSIRYTVNGGTEQTYGSGVAITTEGTNTLAFAAIDGVGNRETTKTATVRIDKSPPVTTTKVPVQAMYWGRADIGLSAMDALSGLAATAWSFSGAPESSDPVASIAAPGEYTLRFHSHDVAGNAETPVERIVIVKPTESARPATLTATHGGSGLRVDLAWVDQSDNESGFELARRVEGGSWSVVATTSQNVKEWSDYDVLWEPSYGYRVRSYTPYTFGSPSEADWVETSGTIRLADQPPVTDAVVSGEPCAYGSATPWLRSAVVTLTTYVDSSTILYSVDSSPVAVYSEPFVITGDGTHTVEFRAEAEGHLVEETHTVYVRLDTTRPVTSANVGYTASQPQLSLTFFDTQSGLGTTWYSFDGGAETTYSPPVAVPNGVHTVTWHSHDAAGNEELPQSGTIIGGPQASVSTPKGSSSTRVRRTLTFSGTLTRTTNHRRLTLLAYRFDGVSWVLARSTTVTTHTPSRRGKTTYRGSIKFTSKGLWKVVARYSGDTRYVQSFSAPKYVRVR